MAHAGRTALRALRALADDLGTPTGSGEPLLGSAGSRWLRLLPYVVAFLFAVSLLPTTITVFIHDYGMAPALAGAFATAQTAPLLLSVTRPLQAWWVVFGADVICAVVLGGLSGTAGRPWPWPPTVVIGYLALMLALSLRERRRTLVAVWLLTGAVGAVLEEFWPVRSVGTWLLLFVLTGVVLLVGGTLQERRDAQRRLAEQENISEAERARRTLLEERARIARELHDVVAHHMSVITVQADSAPYRISGIPKEAQEEFGAIAATARESLAEMRRLLGVLRNEESERAGGPEKTPQPGLDQVPKLVEGTVRAGVPVELTLPREPVELEQAVELSAYRIVQEALANVVRHAPGAQTRVSVTLTPDRGHLTVLVVNSAPPRPSAPLETTGTGHGLVGMRERVRLVDGTLDTGLLPDGGFRVAARLPVGTPVTGPVTEPVMGPAAKPGEGPATGTAEGPATGPGAESAAEPVAGPGPGSGYGPGSRSGSGYGPKSGPGSGPAGAPDTAKDSDTA
ncbi:sensor histidine kinase [Streptomyces sp. MST-110588]|uniref:sensor histidine kinase n=1 Tax=Streptomyces sp. MST-110588 TaxID=2833628 RepID=UPI001F5CC576|nr:sensor histidine kinase [Streptomyces sp. MST-110588]